MPLRRACLGLAFLLPTAALAEENLGTMTVSANRTETEVAASGSSVTVITAEEIEKKQAVTALDVIRDVPGVTFNSYGGMGKTSALSIRGVSAKGILVQIDGVTVADPSSTQSVYDFANLLADNIERIEVLRGNQSTLYGSSAIGGVISITTKTGKGSGKLLTGSGGIEWGSFGTAKTNINARGESGNVYYGTSVSGLTSQGYDLSHGGPNEADGYKSFATSLKVGADLIEDVGALDRLNVEATGRYSKSHNETDQFGYYNPGYVADTFDVNEKFRTIEGSGKLALNADLFNGKFANTLSASQSVIRRDGYLDDSRGSYYGEVYFDGSITKYEYQGTLKPIEDHTFVFGLDRQRDQQNSDTNPARSTTNDGVFGNYILELFDDRLTLTAGIRHDDHETFGGHTTWRTTASYRIPETGTRFHAGYGTGFRAPSLFELYDTYYGGGNADLKPEESQGYDVGIEQSLFDDRLIVGTTFFNTRTQNQIIWSGSGYDNVSSARSLGFENTVSAEVTDEIRLNLTHTYIQARDNSTGRSLGNLPHHSGNARLTYAPKAVEGLETWAAVRTQTWSYDSAFTSNPYLGGYATWDMGASYAVNDWATIYARGENLADKQYVTRGGYAQAGRAAYVGMRAKF